MKIAIASNEKQWYDNIFFSIESSDTVWERNKIEVPKNEQLKFLESNGFQVPIHGKVSEIVPLIHSEIPRVEFRDSTHNTELNRMLKTTYENLSSVVIYEHDQPILMSSEEALSHFPNNFCTRFHTSISTLTTLFIGNVGFSILSTGNTWNSRLFPSESSIVTHRFNLPRPSRINIPVFSIDWIGQELEYAIGFDSDPDTSSVQDFISQEEVYNEIESYYERSHVRRFV